MWRGFAPGFVNSQKGCTRLAAASDKVYQLLSPGRWFSPGTPASSTTKTSRHDIAEILLKVALKHHKSIFLLRVPHGDLHDYITNILLCECQMAVHNIIIQTLCFDGLKWRLTRLCYKYFVLMVSNGGLQDCNTNT